MGNISVQPVAQKMLRVLPAPLVTNFHVAESRRRLDYLLQHENLLNAEVVISATNNLTRGNATYVARQVVQKCCPCYLALMIQNSVKCTNLSRMRNLLAILSTVPKIAKLEASCSPL